MSQASNRVDFYLKEKCLLSANIKNWEHYISALRASNTVTIYRKEYVVDKINMVHDPANIVLKVNIEPLRVYT
ncbi:hypothetical protein [Mesobacillus subterraneus]|uniref:Uncharacterized protein n=1 Tax=Mesobacillus subterraneus TaxID=285983 RepID=A0A3R9E8L5_9BACI|nr:hypothetical protein [Mesobacillus subterraneus]RSD28450.1 hypothetical protein EJA10_05025 [Mesobacillus subterraneus]